MKKFLFIFFSMFLNVAMAQEMLPEHKLLQRLKSRVYRNFQIPSASMTSEQNGSVSMSKKLKGDVLPPSVGPLLSDQWDQYGALTRQTPLIDGKHTTVGCVALAMSQVMHFWKYPICGTGSFTYDDSLGCKQVLTAKFYEHTYQWDKMLDIYREGEYTDEQADAGALLCSDCGISVKMRYGLDASGAQSVMQAVAMPKYFGYDDEEQIYFRDLYTKAEITQMLKTELAKGRPVLMSGYNYNGGHAFVVDGYDENDWFHINLGNPDGPDDGDCWTPLDCMSPDMPKWTEVDSPESGLNLLQLFVMGAVPSTHPTASHRETHIYAMEGIEAVDTVSTDESDIMRICTHQLSNLGRSLHTDSVSIMLAKDGEIVDTLYTFTHEFLLEEIDDTTYTDTIDIRLPDYLQKGTYHLTPMFKDNGEWIEVRTTIGTPNYLLLNVSEEKNVLSSDTANTAYLTLEDFDIPDLIINGSTPDVSITLKNHNCEISGRVYLLMEPLDESGKEFYLLRQGVTMQKDEVSTRRFHKTAIYAPKTGHYRLHFLYDSNLFSSELKELTPETIEVSVLHSGVIEIARR